MAATELPDSARLPRRLSGTDLEGSAQAEYNLRRYEKLVTRVLATRYTSLNRSDIEDCYQQAFLEAWPKRNDYPGKFSNLLVTVALRRASDDWRRYHGRFALVDHQAQSDSGVFAIGDDTHDPEALMQRGVELQRGAELLSMLPVHHQRIWRAYCDAGARHNVKAIAEIAEAEGLKPRQVTKIVDKVKEKARRIAATSLTEDLEIDAAYCRRLEDKIAQHLSGQSPDPVAERHLEDCERCRALFKRTRRIEGAAAALLPPLPVLSEIETFQSTEPDAQDLDAEWARLEQQHGGDDTDGFDGPQPDAEPVGAGAPASDDHSGTLMQWVHDRMTAGKVRAFELASNVQPTGRTGELLTSAKAVAVAGVIAVGGGTATVTVASKADEPSARAAEQHTQQQRSQASGPAIPSGSQAPAAVLPAGAAAASTGADAESTTVKAKPKKKRKAETTSAPQSPEFAPEAQAPEPEPEPTVVAPQPTPTPKPSATTSGGDEFGIEG